MKVFVAKISKNNLPYNVATLHHLPEDPKNFHRTLTERVTNYHGLGTYTLARSHYRNEKRGYKLICTVRIMHEGLTILRYDPQHPAFEPWMGKRLWYEKEAVAQRFIRIPQFQTAHSIRSTISKVRGHVPRQKARKHGWAQLLGTLLKQKPTFTTNS